VIRETIAEFQAGHQSKSSIPASVNQNQELQLDASTGKDYVPAREIFRLISPDTLFGGFRK
jgi:hypothetical protein